MYSLSELYNSSLYNFIDSNKGNDIPYINVVLYDLKLYLLSVLILIGMNEKGLFRQYTVYLADSVLL